MSSSKLDELKLWGAVTTPDGDVAVGYIKLGKDAEQQIKDLMLEIIGEDETPPQNQLNYDYEVVNEEKAHLRKKVEDL